MSSDPACGSDHCVTCADEGVPMRILALDASGLAVCGVEGAEPVDVMTDLVGAVAPGDVVLVHAGVALVRLEAVA